MKKDKYDIAYFLTNKYFVNWVKYPTEESDLFWKDWLRKHPDSHEQYNMARGIIERINFKSDDRIGERKEEILDAILGESKSPFYRFGSIKTESSKWVFPVVVKLIAASVILILMATFLYSSYSVHDVGENLHQVHFITKSNPRGKKTNFFLPDKTQVTLNSESSISYSTNFRGEIREVFLKGEAFFDVSHDSLRTFLVRSGDVVTQVHGTAFNVKAYPKEPVSVALERGLVSVYPHSMDKPTIPFYLKPGEMLDVNLNFENSVKSAIDYEREFGWKEGRLVFKQADLKELVARLERWYDVDISLIGDTSKSWMVSGVFDNESLENVLNGISYARNIQFELNGDHVIIKL
ncbi:FecR family protein [Echinicola shivajiensis]|uniref:FecR family protein n=1 Tax=Echinicola shivajiensis TaxID=1035916 RepID=UPI001BFC773D|nr:FecR domain-containing protein [Echinicola shivajiensis]